MGMFPCVHLNQPTRLAIPKVMKYREVEDASDV